MTDITTLALEEAPAHSAPGAEGPIVLGVKPFSGSEAPIAVARWLAQREDRELHVVSVMEEETDVAGIAAGVPLVTPSYFEEERAMVAGRMCEALRQIGGADLRFRVSVQSGASAGTFVEAARRCDARMIVIGTGRHERLGRFIYGERAMEIVRLADRPVLVVPRDTIAGSISRAVVAVDFSRASLRAARVVMPMLTVGGELTLVHAIPTRDTRQGSSASSRLDERCDELFARFVAELSPAPGIRVSTRVLWGEAVDAVERFARTSAADLLACGRLKGHSMTERLFVGSVSAGLLRRAHCPVLIAPERREDARADVAEPLNGIASWDRPAWAPSLIAFTERNKLRGVRLSTESFSDGPSRCMTQNYVLDSISEELGGRLRVTLIDERHAHSDVTFTSGALRNVTVLTNPQGSETQLEFEDAYGKGTLTFDTPE